jgi:O-methyltransferase
MAVVSPDPQFDEAAIAAAVSDLIRERPDIQIGLWGVVGRGERIIQMCPGMQTNLVWLGDKNPDLVGARLIGTGLRLPVSAVPSIGMAGLDVLVLGVRPEAVDDVIAEAQNGLKNGALIASVWGLTEVTNSAYEGATARLEAAYSPWNIDDAFRSVYAEALMNTLVDKYRCYELWQLVEQSAKLDSGALIEVGVWKGGTGALIAQRAALCGITDRTFLCDTFDGVVKSGECDSTYRGGEHQDCTEDDVNAVMARLGVENYTILTGVFPEETGGDVAHLRFRLCHVDVDVYESAKDVVKWVWPRLVPGGIVVFDDYGNQWCDGITTFVDEMRTWSRCNIIHNLNGHAVAIKY